jgi:hypothetical protein
MFRCEKCKGTAYSSFFKDIAPNQDPTIEWYRPTLKQVLKMRKAQIVWIIFLMVDWIIE